MSFTKTSLALLCSVAFLRFVAYPSTARAAQPDPQLFEIPASAPTEKVTVFCATGRLDEIEYSELWTEHRRRALAARAADDELCYGYALARLSIAADRRYFSGIAKDYARRAEGVLESVLPSRDPRRLPLLAHWTKFAEPEDRPRILERQISLLEEAREAVELPPTFGCGDAPTADSVVVWKKKVEVDLLVTWSLLASARIAVEEPAAATEAAETVLALLEAGRFKGPDSELPYAVSAAVGRSVGLLGDIAEKRQDLVTVEELERALGLLAEIDPSYALIDGLESLAAVRRASGDHAAEEEALREALRVAEEAPAAMWSAVKDLSEFLEVHGRLDEAESLLLEAARSKDEHPVVSSSSQLESFYLRNRRNAELRQILERRLVDEPDSWSLLHRLGFLELQEGRPVRAADLLKRSLKALEAHDLEPHNTNVASVESVLGAAFRSSGREAAAVRAFERAFDIQEAARLKMRDEGRTVVPWMFQGSIRTSLGAGRVATAEDLLEQMEAALDNDSEFRQDSELRVLNMRALLAGARGRSEEAGAWLQRAAAGYWEQQAEKPISLKYSLLHLGRDCEQMGLTLDCWNL